MSDTEHQFNLEPIAQIIMTPPNCAPLRKRSSYKIVVASENRVGRIFLSSSAYSGYVQGSNFAKQYWEKFILLLAGKDALPSFNCGGRINHDTPANKISESATSCAVRL
jgi:hypothetical protein